MNAVAALVVVIVAAVSIWAWRLAPGRAAVEQFVEIWKHPWGKQFYFDFFGLNLVLALWMLSDALASGRWALAIVCVIALPFFGAMSAGTYWVLRSLGGP
jgi:hypothetical protein